MEAKDIFYWTASVAFILISVFIVVVAIAAYSINKWAKASMLRISLLGNEFARTWGRVTLAGIIVRTIRGFLRR